MDVVVGNTSVLGAVSIQQDLGSAYNLVLAKSPVVDAFNYNILQASILADSIHFTGAWKVPERFRELDWFKFEPATFVTPKMQAKRDRQDIETFLSDDPECHKMTGEIESLHEQVISAFDNAVETNFDRLHADIHRQLSSSVKDLPTSIDRKYFVPSNLGLRGLLYSPVQTVLELHRDLAEAKKKNAQLLLNEFNSRLIRARFSNTHSSSTSGHFFRVLQREFFPNFDMLEPHQLAEIRRSDAIHAFRQWVNHQSEQMGKANSVESLEKEVQNVLAQTMATIKDWAYNTKPTARSKVANVVEFGITNIPVAGPLIGAALTAKRSITPIEVERNYHIYFIIELGMVQPP